MKLKSESESCSVVSDSLWPHRLYSPWDSLGQNTGVGSLFLLQEIFPTQGLNLGFLHCRQILYQLSHQGSPRTLEWVAYSFSRGSSQPRSRTGVAYIAGGFFTNWAIRKPMYMYIHHNFCIHPFVDRHLDCSHVLAVVNNAAKNMGCRNIFELLFFFFAYLPKGEIAASYGSSSFKFLRWCVSLDL